MPDSREQIGEHLGKLGLEPAREAEIRRELSEHIADHAADLEACGVASDTAEQGALALVSDWAVLRKEIILAETEEANMNYRTKALWLPALGALTLSSLMLAILQFAGVVPRFYWLNEANYAFFTFYVPWLLALPAIGALAAFWSQRSGGRAIHRLFSALAPSMGLLGFFLISPLITLLIYAYLRLFAHTAGARTMSFPLHTPPAAGMLVVLVSWILLPAVGLLLGAAPFMRHSHPHS